MSNRDNKRKTTEIPSFLKEDELNEQTMEIEKVSKPVKKTTSKKRRKTIQEMLVSFLLFIALTVILVIAGINIAGFFMNNNSDSEPAATATAEPTELPGFTPTPTPEPSEIPATADNGSGSLYVMVDQITIRNAPTLNGEAMGTVYYGETYSVYDVQQADGYTWYLIDQTNGGWIASDGSWVSYTSN